MRFGQWFSMRGTEFVRKRGAVLLKRYGLTPTKAQDRIEACLNNLVQSGCAPTFFTPGSIVKRYPFFIRRLQDKAAEIAVHSYDHIDLRTIPLAEAAKQLVRAAQTFELSGLESHGFRCPYLSYRDELVDMLPEGLFSYSSNVAIRRYLNPVSNTGRAGLVFQTIDKFYRPRESREVVCVPWTRHKLVEIPVCVPDDLQLRDGLGLGPDGVSGAWCQILKQTHDRSELFTVIFHPEMGDYCERPFVAVLQEAKRLKPWVWLARLRDISDWWVEKSKFQSEVSHISTGLRVTLTCSSRATVLVRGLDVGGIQEAWNGTYFRLNARTVDIPAEPRPFVGVPPTVRGEVVSFLRDQGYIVDTGKSAPRCAVYLDDHELAQQKNQVELVDWIEQSPGPLIKFGRWPDGAKSAMCITGDLDALSLLDYASRIFIH